MNRFNKEVVRRDGRLAVEVEFNPTLPSRLAGLVESPLGPTSETDGFGSGGSLGTWLTSGKAGGIRSSRDRTGEEMDEVILQTVQKSFSDLGIPKSARNLENVETTF